MVGGIDYPRIYYHIVGPKGWKWWLQPLKIVQHVEHTCCHIPRSNQVDFLWSNRIKPIYNQQNLYNPRGKIPTGNLTRRIETILSAATIGGCKYQSTFKRLVHGLEGFGLGHAPNMYVVAHFFKGMSKTPWAQGRPGSDTRDWWRRWWEGPSDPIVGEGPVRWKRLPPTGTRSHEGEAMSYAQLMAWGF